MLTHANPTLSSAAASTHGAATPSLELLEARKLRDALKTLLRTEQSAMAEFLVALADFDRRRGWEALGHASLFAFLHVELKLSKGAAYVRFSAARLLQAHPRALAPLRDGRLCLSSAGELGRVATPENFAEVLPRFFGCSSREAREVAAAIAPREAPPHRDQVTRVVHPDWPGPQRQQPHAAASPAMELRLAPSPATVAAALTLAVPVDSESVRAHEPDRAQPARGMTSSEEVEPLTADLRRLHITVSRRFLRELEMARGGLSHSIPNATTEHVLQEGLRLLLEKQARARGLVKRPRATLAAKAAARLEAQVVISAAPRLENPTLTGSQQTQSGNCSISRPEGRAMDPPTTEPRPPRRGGPRETIPAAVRRAVWARDAGRCSWPLDTGGCCGSTHRLELDHVVPWATWGDSTEANLRLVCGRHNALAARQTFGARVVERYTA
jgi:hypothetical protein